MRRPMALPTSENTYASRRAMGWRSSFFKKVRNINVDVCEYVLYALSKLRIGVDQSLTSIAKDDPWYQAFCRAVVDKHGLKVRPEIFPAATDSRFIRQVGIPALGFSPMPNTPVLLHDHNEFLNEKIFVDGINVIYDLVKELASL